MLVLDYLYVTNWSLWGDIKLILRTVPALHGQDARRLLALDSPCLDGAGPGMRRRAARAGRRRCPTRRAAPGTPRRPSPRRAAPRASARAGSRRRRAAARTSASARLDRAGVAPGPHRGGALALAPLGLGVDPVQLDRRLALGRIAVDADDHLLARLHPLVVGERGLLDLILHPARLDRGHRAAELVDLGDQRPRLVGQRVGQRLDVVAAGERIGGVGGAGLGGEDLLGAKRDRGAVLGRQRERLVERVRVQALGASRRPPRTPAPPPARCCSRPAGRSASSRRSGRGSAASGCARRGRRSARA